ncbi:MAG: hypothetical protein KA191_02575 [Verrucomicrobia bacterium]|nr:hypothetical protein [Verrucomicrobiota bacterium]OQC67267.1 MAG: hypothetical protein BWX48_00922 [Verrucomicrobia bacterium ADurb.Bin006]MDI9381510.1 hypothetical protein [Verrucomicrobiota bacterium]NMD19236.1 hypothetical protein [Verrucomicrobiota bacterium]HNU98360.1 hypothetical protein [Verrucomicrobiota bacterium]
MERYADLLGKTNDAARFAGQARRMTDAFNGKHLRPAEVERPSDPKVACGRNDTDARFAFWSSRLRRGHSSVKHACQAGVSDGKRNGQEPSPGRLFEPRRTGRGRALRWIRA